ASARKKPYLPRAYFAASAFVLHPIALIAASSRTLPGDVHGPGQPIAVHCVHLPVQPNTSAPPPSIAFSPRFHSGIALCFVQLFAPNETLFVARGSISAGLAWQVAHATVPLTEKPLSSKSWAPISTSSMH